MDSQSVDQWAAALASGIEDRQITALRQISSLESITGLATTVVGLAGSANDEVRMWAAEAMEQAIQPEPADVTDLIELMSTSPDGEVCYWSVTMIGRLGVRGADSVAALENCLLHSNYLAAKERAVWAISQIGPDAMAAVPTLKKLVQEQTRSPRLVRLATEVLRRMTSASSGEAAA